MINLSSCKKSCDSVSCIKCADVKIAEVALIPFDVVVSSNVLNKLLDGIDNMLDGDAAIWVGIDDCMEVDGFVEMGSGTEMDGGMRMDC